MNIVPLPQRPRLRLDEPQRSRYLEKLSERTSKIVAASEMKIRASKSDPDTKICLEHWAEILFVRANKLGDEMRAIEGRR